MNKFKSLIIVVLCVGFALTSSAQNLSVAESQELISNLNYIQYSIAKIKSTNNKAIAEDEYYSVINELNLKTFSNNEIKGLYKEFLDECAGLKLKQNEKDFLRKLNEQQQKDAYLNAFSNFGSVFVGGKSPHQMIASLVYTSVASAFAVMNTKSQLKSELAKEMFYLDQGIASSIYNMQTQLFITSGTLLNKSSKGRINEDSMNTFLKALGLETNKEKINSLEQLKASFDLFPPFWFELGNAYQEVGKFDKASECYDKFEQLKKHDVMAKDKNYVKLAKNIISIYMGNDPTLVEENARKSKSDILRYIDVIKDNSLDSELGALNSYLAKIYFLLGDVDNAKLSIRRIVASKTLYPEYISEALYLKSLILCDENNNSGEVYRLANNYSKIIFGNQSDMSVRFFTEKDENTSWYRSAYNKFFGSEPAFIDDKYLYFSYPKQLTEGVSLYIEIDDKVYIPEYRSVNSFNDESLCFVDYEMSDIKDAKNIVFHFKSDATNDENCVTFRIEKLDEDYYENAEKAFRRIGSDIAVHNAHIAAEYGKTIDSYKYTINDEQDFIEDTREEQEKYGKKNCKTRLEIESNIANILSTKLAPDMENLQNFLKKVQESYYKLTENVLINSYITMYDGDYYVIGVLDIYDVKTGKEAHFNTDYDIVFKTPESVVVERNGNVNEYLQLALSGNVTGMYKLGEAYYEGYGVAKNYKEAATWFFKAVNAQKSGAETDVEKLDRAKSCKYLWMCYKDGNGVKKNSDVAEYWKAKAKDGGIAIEE